ncbi:hypothetical protein Vse01_36300 [Micromonospora sediminimaris]|uniref:DUF1963 domain-containing protein n=1 Tax=Micromonospora sediminimaris TaxID=547162 RepID=A0A9W5USV4_9ACTN|nr:hypothetical protein Vse01_36300 [Micromonospora sediminimaris]
MAMAWLEGSSRSPSATGPFDPWLMPRLEMSWRPSLTPIDNPVAKLGGLPVWLDEPFWPVSAQFGSPMTFIGQFPLPGPSLRMSYLFMTQDDESLAGTFEAEGGENALLVQPGGRVPSFVTGLATGTGPTLWRRGSQWTERVPVELHIDVHLPDEATASSFEREVAYQDAARRGVHFDADADHGRVDCRSYVGGQPLLWQPWTTDLDASWRFFFQLDDAEGWGDDEYALNFGGGSGYAFLSEDQREGRFFWDCV